MSVHHLLRKAINEKLRAIEQDVVRSALSHDDYIRQCGMWAGVEWALIELDLLTRNSGGESDIDDFDSLADDGLTQHHN